MTSQRIRQVEAACAQLAALGETVTFVAIAQRTGIPRGTLYRNPALNTTAAWLMLGLNTHTSGPKAATFASGHGDVFATAVAGASATHPTAAASNAAASALLRRRGDPGMPD